MLKTYLNAEFNTSIIKGSKRRINIFFVHKFLNNSIFKVGSQFNSYFGHLPIFWLYF